MPAASEYDSLLTAFSISGPGGLPVYEIYKKVFQCNLQPLRANSQMRDLSFV